MSRRAVLLAAAALPLAGCGVRFESDAPGFLPTPSPDPAGPPILAERERVARVLAVLPRSPGTATDLRTVHTDQLQALDAALAALDPPVSAPSTSGPGGAGRTTPANGTGRNALADAADLEAAGLDEAGLAALDGLVPRAAGIVVASHAQRAVLLELLGASGVRVPPPARTPWHAATPSLARGLVDDLRAAAYGLEVAAAHLDPGPRGTVLAGLGVLRDAERHLGTLVPDLPPRPLGYRLPRPVTTPAEATTLATGVLDRLVASTLAVVPATADARRDADATTQAPTGQDTAGAPDAPTSTDSPDGASTVPGGDDMATLVRIVRIAELTRVRGGGRLRPLPGLRPPAPSSPSAAPTTSPSPGR